MNEQNEKAVDVLNDLIEYCKDGQKGYQTAAEDVKNTRLKSVFTDFANQRAEFAGELKEQVRMLGADPEKSGNLAGTLHRGWIDIKSVLSSGDEEAILKECARGDSAAEAKYDEALKADLPMSVRDVVKKQHDAIRSARNQIRSMKDQQS